MLRPHQSLELVEIMKKFARTWGCKLDLMDFVPPGPRQTGDKLRYTYERRAWAGCRAREGAEAEIGTPMFRPHQSLELVEIIKKFAWTRV